MEDDCANGVKMAARINIQAMMRSDSVREHLHRLETTSLTHNSQLKKSNIKNLKLMVN
jgi:2-phosphoglycerate kinase